MRPRELAVRTVPDLRAVRIDDGLLLFDPRRVRAHALNRSARLVWERLDRLPGSAAEVAASLGAELGLAADAVETDVEAVIDDLFAEQLVLSPGAETEPAPSAARTFPNVPHTQERVAVDPTADEFVGHSPLYSALGVAWRFHTTDPALGRFLQRRLAPLRAPHEPDPAGSVWDYCIVGADVRDPIGDRAGLVTVDGHLVGRVTPHSQLAAFVLWHMNQLISTASHAGLLLHASAASFPRPGPAGATRAGALAFPAQMNAGKSTLVTGLVGAGYGYLTDETVAVDTAGCDAVPYPKAIGLDPGSWPLFPELAPDPDPSTERYEHEKWYVDPSRVGPGRVEHAPVPLRAIVAPTYRPDEPTRLEVLAPLEAALVLASNCFNLAACGQPGLDTVARLATSLPCLRLSMQDLATSVEAIDGLAAELAH